MHCYLPVGGLLPRNTSLLAAALVILCTAPSPACIKFQEIWNYLIHVLPVRRQGLAYVTVDISMNQRMKWGDLRPNEWRGHLGFLASHLWK